ncbi:MAG: hypothetical protein MUC50_19025 [Myxococcota bacterium]|jgi:hypothetical protein|nr:hypothetical protein [Myxococcota bacterium]
MKRLFCLRLLLPLAVSCALLSCDAHNQTKQPEPHGSDSVPDLTETLLEDCQELDSLEGYPMVPYYRLRFEYATSSDWSRLAFLDPIHIIKVRTMSISGEATKALAEYDGITTNQPSESAKNGSTIAVTADYAFRPAAIDVPLSLELKKGAIGTSTVRISAIIEGQAQLLQEVTQEQGAQLQVDLSSLKGISPWTAPIAPVRRMAFALYYPWYNLKSWESDDLRDQPEIPYDSGDPVAVERQMTQARSAGIDGFLSSWWGPGSKTDTNLSVVLDVAEQNDFFIGMFLETNSIIEAQNENMALVEDELVRWIEYYATTYGEHPGAMKVDGKPVVMPWVTCTVPVETWQNVRETMAANSIEVTMLADCSKPEYFDVFDGAIGDDVDIGKTLRYYALLADTPAPKIWMSNAKPGYDERLLEDRVNPRYTDREDGQYFKTQLNSALQANPQWIRLYTWNEYPENTYIEPSKNFGDKYLEIAGDYVLPWKCPK